VRAGVQDVGACAAQGAVEPGCVSVAYTERNDGPDPVPAWGEWLGPYPRSLPSPEWAQYVNLLTLDAAPLLRQPLYANLDVAAGSLRRTLSVPLRAASDGDTGG
jgi:hypothetical protein